MGWINIFRATRQGARPDPSDDPVMTGVPDDGAEAARSGPGDSNSPVRGGDRQVSDEIKRRQRSLTARYVAAVRAR